MRTTAILSFVLCAGLIACHEPPPAAVPEVALDPPFRSFAIRSNTELDSLARGPLVTAEEALRLKGSLALADTGSRHTSAPKLVVMGRQRTGKSIAYLLLRDSSAPQADDRSAEVLLVDLADSGAVRGQFVLGMYVRSKSRKEICAVDWRAPELRAKWQAHWVGEQDSLMRYHVQQRAVFTQLRIADGVQVLLQDTARSERLLEKDHVEWQ